MTAEEWKQAKELFEAALAREPSARAAFLIENCPDIALRREVGKLLGNFQEAGEFLSQPLLQPDMAQLGPISEGRAEDKKLPAGTLASQTETLVQSMEMAQVYSAAGQVRAGRAALQPDPGDPAPRVGPRAP